VLRPGALVGTITWAWERGPRAGTVRDQILAESGTPPAPLRRVDTGLDLPSSVEALLRSAGLRPARIWPERLRHQWDKSSFWELASGSGPDRFRLGHLDPAARAGVLARAKNALGQYYSRGFPIGGCAAAVRDVRAA
jgi:hypothetical protein